MQRIVAGKGVVLVDIELGAKQQMRVFNRARHRPQHRHGQQRHGPRDIGIAFMGFGKQVGNSGLSALEHLPDIIVERRAAFR